jgi:hypothetical protein
MRSQTLAVPLVLALLSGPAPLCAQAVVKVSVQRHLAPLRAAPILQHRPRAVSQPSEARPAVLPGRAHAVRQVVPGAIIVHRAPHPLVAPALVTVPRVAPVQAARAPLRVTLPPRIVVFKPAFPRTAVTRVVVVPAVGHVAGALPAAYAPGAAPPPAAALPAPLVLSTPAFAIDGDTFVSGGARYRLSGVDAPELDQPGGLEARERLQALLRLGNVTVIAHARDIYGRIVAEVLVGGMNVASVLRSEGFAR